MQNKSSNENIKCSIAFNCDEFMIAELFGNERILKTKFPCFNSFESYLQLDETITTKPHLISH